MVDEPIKNKKESKKETTPEESDFFVSTLGDGRYIETLADAFTEEGKRKLKHSSGTGLKRINPSELELEYKLDEVVFSCVNFYSQQVATDFEIVGDPKLAAILEDFKDRVGLLSITQEMVRDACISGNSFWEKIKANRGNGNIVGLQRIDFKKMDYIRRGENGLVEEDNTGKPIGYRFLPAGDISLGNIKLFTDSEKDSENRKWINEVVGGKNDILHFKLFGRGNELGLGYVEATYKLIFLKLNIRAGFAQTGYNAGFPRLIITAGELPNPATGYQGHKITSAERTELENAFNDLEVKNKIMLPPYVTVTPLQATTGEAQERLLEYCDSRIAGCFGIPLGLVLGTEDKSNKSTLEVSVTRGVDKRVKSIQNDISELFRKHLFPDILEQNGIDLERVSIPKIKWKEIVPVDLNRKAARLTKYIEVGLPFTPEEMIDIKNMVLVEEGVNVTKKTPEEKAQEFLEGFEQRSISPEEAIAVLKKIQTLFSESDVQDMIDAIIKRILLKSGVDTQIVHYVSGETKVIDDIKK